MKIVVLSAHPDDAETGAGGFCRQPLKTDKGFLTILDHAQGKDY